MLIQWIVAVWTSVLNICRNDVCNLLIIDMLNLTDKYRIIDTTDCRCSNAQCEKIDSYCFCHCYPGYIVVNGYCVKGKSSRTFENDQWRRLVKCCLWMWIFFFTLNCIWFNDFTYLLMYALFLKATNWWAFVLLLQLAIDHLKLIFTIFTLSVFSCCPFLYLVTIF